MDQSATTPKYPSRPRAEFPRASRREYFTDLSDEFLAGVFHHLPSADRRRCTLVCKRWLAIEGRSRHRLSLNAQAHILPLLPTLFTRFDSVTKLALKCDRRTVSVGDEALVQISLRCRNLTRLKLRACKNITDAGIEAFAKNCVSLKKLSCVSCKFGAKGMNAVLQHCITLEELSVKRLNGRMKPIGPGPVSGSGLSLKVVCLKELHNGQCFGPLISGSTNLKTLKIIRCTGDWDEILQTIPNHVAEVHLESIWITDAGLAGISSCAELEILQLVKTPQCSNIGLSSVAENCGMLRKLYVDGWKTNRIGDKGLVSVGKHCANLQELVLIGVDPTMVSLETLATRCLKLERLALCGSDTVGDAEISCIAAKCGALKKLCIKSCPVSNLGIAKLARGCPNLEKVKVRTCRGVTSEGAGWLRASRETLTVILDGNEADNPDASGSDGCRVAEMEEDVGGARSEGSASWKTRLARLGGIFSGTNLIACTFRRWTICISRRG